jgi:hypothetical protein
MHGRGSGQWHSRPVLGTEGLEEMRLSASAACALSVASLVCSGARAARLASKVCASVYVCMLDRAHCRSAPHCLRGDECTAPHVVHSCVAQPSVRLACCSHACNDFVVHREDPLFFPRHRSALQGAARSQIERTHTRLPLAALSRTLILGQVPLLPLPPMGWMSWLRFECETDCAAHPTTCISASLYTSAADAMVAGGYAAAG